MGRIDDALAEIQRAEQVEPISLVLKAWRTGVSGWPTSRKACIPELWQRWRRPRPTWQPRAPWTDPLPPCRFVSPLNAAAPFATSSAGQDATLLSEAALGKRDD